MDKLVGIKIDRQAKIPLYLQIKNQLKEMILTGVIPEESRLFPSRKLAKLLKVNRSTVVAAYEELLAEGLTEAHVGRGTIVRKKGYFLEGRSLSHPFNWSEFLALSPPFHLDSLLRDIIAYCSSEDIISLAAGVPATELFPVEEFREVINDILRKEKYQVFQHCPTEGYYPLRELLANWSINPQGGSSPDNVFIVSGSQQGLYLLAEIFLNPGDVVIVESPTYVGALSVFRARGARIVGIPGDEKGLRVDVLENLLWRQVPRLIYILPTFQNPRGVVLSPERRKEILELAYRFRVPIIEDDPYSHLYFKNPPPASLKSQDKYDQVIYLSTFSKIIFPGLRVGWINAPRPVVERLSQVKQFLDLHSPTLGQRALYEFCRRGLLEGHLEKSREIYARKKDIMLKALHRFCSPWLTSTDPEGGFYLWGELPPGWDSKELLREAVDEKVVFVGGETFFPEGEGQNYLRLNFSFQPEELLIEGSRRLGRALTKLAERNKDHQERRKLNSKPIV